MKPQLSTIFALATLVSFPFSVQAQPMQENGSTSQPKQIFHCDMSNDPPSTVVRAMLNSDHPETFSFIHWSAQYFQSESEALSLCQDVSEQLQAFYETGELNSLSLASDELEGETVVCLQGQTESECHRDQVLFTLNTEKEPEAVLYELLAEDFQPPRTRGDFPTRVDLNPFLQWL